MNTIYLYGRLEGMEVQEQDALNSYTTKLIVKSHKNFLDPFEEEQSLNLDVYLWKGAQNKINRDDIGQAFLLIQGRLDSFNNKIIIVAEQIRQI